MKNDMLNQATNHMISKTGFTTGFMCRYATYMYVLHHELAKPIENELILINGHEFGETAARFMNATYQVKFSYDKKKMVEETQNAIKAGHKTIAEATFIHDGMFCSVDILVINKDSSFTIYEVKSGSEIKEVNKLDIAFQYAVLRGAGYKINKANLMHANGSYCFGKDEKIDFKKLFVIEDMTKVCEELLPTIKKEVKAISDSINMENPPEHDFSSNCNAPFKCPFMHYCIKEAGMPEDSNIFNITGPQFIATKLNRWYYNGIKTYQDIVANVNVANNGNGNPKDASWKYVQQARCYLEKSDAPVNMDELGKFLKGIVYPIASFDYEGFATAVPHYYGLKPSQQVVFQFSYDYIESEGAQRQHYDFLAEPGKDPREEICKALAKLPKAKTILVWNKTYEQSRNKEMSNLEGFEKFKDMLTEMADNMVDLAVPFRNRTIYLWKTNGSYSLKPVTEAMIPNLRYRDLKVHNGTEAAEKFMAMINMTTAEKKKCIQSLKMYNNQDTYGPLKILEKMYGIYRNDDNFVLFTDMSQKDMLGQELHIGDTVICDEGISVITRFTDKYVFAMLMRSGREVRRKSHNIVLIQEFVSDKEKPRDISTTTGTLMYGDIAVCNRGIGKVVGFTRYFIRIKLSNDAEILRMRHNIHKISC